MIRKKSDKLFWFKPDPTNQKPNPSDNENPKPKKHRSPIDLRKVISTISVPRTDNGRLAKMLSESETRIRQVCTTKVRVVEKVGTTMKALLVKSNSWSGSRCPRANCLPCNTADDSPSDCRRRNVTYYTECQLCKKDGIKVQYIGETSNSLSERIGRHIEDALDDSRESHMRRHIQEEHPGALLTDVYSARTIIQHLSAFRRQLEEAYMIKQFRGGSY